MGKRGGLIVWLSLLAGLSSLSAANAFSTFWDPKYGALFASIVAAANTATAAYVAAARPMESGAGGRHRADV